MKRKSVAQEVAPVATPAPVVPLPDPEGASVQSRMEKARKTAQARFGRSALGLGAAKTGKVKAARPVALGAGY